VLLVKSDINLPQDTPVASIKRLIHMNFEAMVSMVFGNLPGDSTSNPIARC
jgi:hypothetical protein